MSIYTLVGFRDAKADISIAQKRTLATAKADIPAAKGTPFLQKGEPSPTTATIELFAGKGWRDLGREPLDVRIKYAINRV